MTSPSESEPADASADPKARLLAARRRRAPREPSGDPALRARYDELKAAPDHLPQLRSLSLEELKLRAQELDIETVGVRRKQDLILPLMRALASADGLVFTEGVLEILPEGFGFLRSPQYAYLPSPDDVYVSPSQIKALGLRPGDLVQGRARPPEEEGRYAGLLRIEAVNWQRSESATDRPAFENLTPIFPTERIVFESGEHDLVGRALDLIAPIGLGQRALIVAPPRAGKTTVLRTMASALSQPDSGLEVIVLLIDERPEEVTEMERAVPAEVVASTFDEAPARHVQVASMVLEKARRIAEGGGDVVILLDSITRLARAHNADAAGSGRIMSGGIDATALQKPKRFFGSARALEEGGSLTIIATALTETNSRMDEVIFEEFKGTGNCEIVLDRRMAERRLYPALDLARSGTRREDRLLDPDEAARIATLRTQLIDQPPHDALHGLLRQLRRTPGNIELLLGLEPQAPA